MVFIQPGDYGGRYLIVYDVYRRHYTVCLILFILYFTTRNLRYGGDAFASITRRGLARDERVDIVRLAAPRTRITIRI